MNLSAGRPVWTYAPPPGGSMLTPAGHPQEVPIPHSDRFRDVGRISPYTSPLKEESYMFHFAKKRTVVMAAIGSLALAAGAYAYFTSTGTGSGSATVGTSTAWAIANNGTTGTALTPGGATEQTLAYSVTNPSSG